MPSCAAAEPDSECEDMAMEQEARDQSPLCLALQLDEIKPMMTLAFIAIFRKYRCDVYCCKLYNTGEIHNVRDSINNVIYWILRALVEPTYI